MKVFRLASVAVVAMTILFGDTGRADASGGLPPPTVTTTYKVVAVTTYKNWVDFTRPVARCTASAGSTCTITRASAVSTTVQAGLGYSKSDVAGNIGFSLTRMSTTSVSCSSPKLKRGQSFVGYSEGTHKSYKIEKWQGVSWVHAPPAKRVATSGYLDAFQPFNYPAIYCDVETG